jgi:signal transduction histidine kinase
MPPAPAPTAALADRLLLGAGLLSWGVSGVPVARHLLGAPGVWQGLRAWAWLVAFALFGALFVALAAGPQEGGRAHSPRAERWGFAGLCAAALGVVASFQTGVEAVLLVMTAGMAPSLLPVRGALAWVAVQSLLLGFTYARAFPTERALVTTAIYAGFQLFALGVALLREREAAGRREQARLHAQLQAAQARLGEREREGERLRIARELHDSLGHRLTALSLTLEAAVHTTQGAPGAAHVERARELSRALLGELREAVATLREAPPLSEALAGLTRGLPGGLQVHLAVREGPVPPPPEAAWSVLRCVQEVLTNTLRHAGADNLWVEVEAGEGGVRVRARDDGRGAAALLPGAGLSGMRERFERLGGRVELRSAEGRGVEVDAWLPALPGTGSGAGAGAR